MSRTEYPASGRPRRGNVTVEIASQRFSRITTVVLLLGTLFVVPSRLEATSVVASFDHRNAGLVIATDCRVNRENGSISEWKIIEEPNCVAAIAGLYLEPNAQFDLRKLVSGAC